VTWETVKMLVSFSQNKRRAYKKGVLIDGSDIFNVHYGNLIKYSANFDILEETGGFVSGGEHSPYFEVKYEITVQVRKGALIEAVRGNYTFI
jgi:hypothetical protein